MESALLTTIPAGELDAALRWLVREHGAAALPILRHCLADRPERAVAAAHALGTLPSRKRPRPSRAPRPRAATKAVRTAARRALYRLRQAGVDRPTAAPAPPPQRRVALGDAWASAVDGTGGRGLWLTLAGPYGERTLLAAVLSGRARPPRLLHRRDAEEADRRAAPRRAGAEPAAVGDGPGEAGPGRRSSRRPSALAPGAARAAGARRLDRAARDPGGRACPRSTRGFPPRPTREPALLERSGALCVCPSWRAGSSIRPASRARPSEWLQAKESRLVLSEQIKAERLTALIDRIIEHHFDAPTRRRWRGRLEDEAYVLLALGRTEEAWSAVAVARALADPAAALGRIPSCALVERSLEIAGEVATGRLSAETASRVPRARAAEAPGG